MYQLKERLQGLAPGHGGILGRLDGMTFAAPLFRHFVGDTHG